MLRPESEWVWNPVKPIVSKRLWQYCNDLVHKNARPKRQLGRQSNFAFGNLVWCECGAKMYVNSGCRNWFKCARCGNKLHLQGLENTFVAEVVKAFGTAENISKQLGTAVNVSESQKISLKRIDKEISKLDSKLDKLLDLYTDAKLSKESYGQRAKAYEADLARLRKEKATLEKAIAKEVKNLPSPTEIAEEIKSLSSCWAGLSIVERQEVVAGIIDKVEVQKETIAFSFHESPSLIEITKKLRKLMVAQPFCDMRIVCDKPGKPPKKPHNNMCEPYVKFIEDRMRQGFTATEIRDQLQAELGFIVSMGPLSKITQRLKRSVFGIAQPLFPKPSLCDFHRTTIEQMVRQNWSAGQICEELKEKHNFRGTPRMVSRYMRALRLVIGVKLPTAQEKNPYWPYRDRIISKVKAGWKPMMILTSLEHEVGSVGSYRRFHAFVQWLRTSVLKGQTVKPMAGRLCVPHADFIAAAVSKGCSPPIILKRLKKERHFKGKLSTVRSFIASLKKTL